jgi:hypothetical protein
MVTVMVLATTLAAPAQTVVAVVNGEPITALDVESRTKFTHLSTQKQPARPDVINELIDEKLKIREGKRWGIEHTDAEIDSMYANMASRMHQSLRANADWASTSAAHCKNRSRLASEGCSHWLARLSELRPSFRIAAVMKSDASRAPNGGPSVWNREISLSDCR